ncbi:RNA-directed DNA polymerase, eukaryota, reverse transcriptase zinc-binding domain protein [Tanacetum coccineum]
MENIIRVLQIFYLALGLKININKSNVYGIGVSAEEVSTMANNMGSASGVVLKNRESILGLFRLEQDKGFLIIDRIHNGQWSWNWSRNDLSIRNSAYLRDLLIEISEADDKALPRKVSIFMWRLKLDRLPHQLNISSCGIEILDISCPSCNDNVESNLYIFFNVLLLETFRGSFLFDEAIMFLLSFLMIIGVIG